MGPNAMKAPEPDLSVVIPVYNEEHNIAPLIERLVLVLASMTDDWEIIFVNDGSSDGTQTVLETFARIEPRIRVIQFRRNYGQTAALAAGIARACKSLVATLDGDLQNDPADLPRMVAELLQGDFDVVHGWRQNRQDHALLRKFPSRVANWLIARVTGLSVHDLGCALRVMRREIAQELELYGEMHRFIPILVHSRGAKSTELVTHHHPRRFGQSKYGLERTFGVLLDLLTVKFLLDYFSSPMRFFGRLALACFGLGVLSLVGTIGMKVLRAVDMTGNPLLLLAVFSTLVGVQLLSLGILGELCIRIYYAAGTRPNFAVRKLVNFDEERSVKTSAAEDRLVELLPHPHFPSPALPYAEKAQKLEASEASAGTHVVGPAEVESPQGVLRAA